MEKHGDFVIADGVDDIKTAVRWQLKKRCKSDKIGVGGGVISHFDPLDSLQYSYDEMKSSVDASYKTLGLMFALMFIMTMG